MSLPGPSAAELVAVQLTPEDTPEPTTKKGKERVSIRKKRAIRLGRKIARIIVGPKKEIFAVHEELLCASSPFFRERLQKNRKPVEGECSVCLLNMHEEDEEIVFCCTCGGNVHYDCMKRWEHQNQPEENDTDTEATCPLCRADWIAETPSCVCSTFDAKTFSMYSQWLYTFKMPLGDATGKDPLEFEALTCAWKLGGVLGDAKFSKSIILAALETMEDTRQFPTGSRVRSLYAATSVDCDLRKIVVQAFVKGAPNDWIEKIKSRWYPTEFVADIATVLFQNRGGRESASTVLLNLRAVVEAGGKL